MAELKRSNKALEWDRLPNGRFAISVSVVATLADGTTVEAPECMFVLSQEEEQDLKRALTGLEIVTPYPNGGSHGVGTARSNR